MLLYIVTPEKEVVNTDIENVILPGQSGEMEILPEHTHMISLLEPGVVIYKESSSNKERAVAIAGGTVEIKDNLVRLVSEVAERSDEIDVERAEKALKAAEKKLSREEIIADEKEFIKAEAALKRALARLKAAQYK